MGLSTTSSNVISKKTIYFIGILMLTLVFFCLQASPVVADDRITVIHNGEELDWFTDPPTIINGRTMIPYRYVLETLGADIEWNEDLMKITATKDDTTIEITIGSNILYKNGSAIRLDSPATIINDRAFVPVRAVAESFDCRVEWDGVTRTVYIYSDYVVIGKTGDGATTVMAKSVKTIGDAGGALDTLVIAETTAGVFDTDEVIELRLPKGFTWDYNDVTGVPGAWSLVNSVFSYNIDYTGRVLTIRLSDNSLLPTRTAGRINIGSSYGGFFKINVEDIAKPGDVYVTVSSDKGAVAEQDILIAEYIGDYGDVDELDDIESDYSDYDEWDDMSLNLVDLTPFTAVAKKGSMEYEAALHELRKEYLSDNMGNSDYETGFEFSASGVTPVVREYTYILDGEYDRFTGVMAVKYGSRNHTQEKYYGILTVYGDGYELYRSEELRGGVRPIDFDIDITGVDELMFAIEMATPGVTYSHFVIMLDPVLWVD